MAETTMPTKSEMDVSTTREQDRYLTPPVDIYEVEDGLKVIVDLPGVSKENLHVTVENDLLTISGKAEHVAPGNPIYREFQLMDFYRQFRLGELVDQEKISADVKNGVLTLVLPKREEAKPKQVEIRVA